MNYTGKKLTPILLERYLHKVLRLTNQDVIHMVTTGKQSKQNVAFKATKINPNNTSTFMKLVLHTFSLLLRVRSSLAVLERPELSRYLALRRTLFSKLSSKKFEGVMSSISTR